MKTVFFSDRSWNWEFKWQWQERHCFEWC